MKRSQRSPLRYEFRDERRRDFEDDLNTSKQQLLHNNSVDLSQEDFRPVRVIEDRGARPAAGHRGSDAQQVYRNFDDYDRKSPRRGKGGQQQYKSDHYDGLRRDYGLDAQHRRDYSAGEQPVARRDFEQQPVARRDFEQPVTRREFEQQPVARRDFEQPVARRAPEPQQTREIEIQPRRDRSGGERLREDADERRDRSGERKRVDRKQLDRIFGGPQDNSQVRSSPNRDAYLDKPIVGHSNHDASVSKTVESPLLDRKRSTIQSQLQRASPDRKKERINYMAQSENLKYEVINAQKIDSDDSYKNHGRNQLPNAPPLIVHDVQRSPIRRRQE